MNDTVTPIAPKSASKNVAEKTSEKAPKKLGIDLKAQTNKTFHLDPNADRISRITVALIDGDPDQPRHHFDKEKIQELAESIKKYGLLQPIAVREHPQDRDRYMVVYGGRRHKACIAAGIEKVNCIVISGHIEEKQLIENVQREDLKPLEEAIAFKRYMDKYQITQGALAEVVGKKRSTVVEILSIASLPNDIKDALDEYPNIRKSQLILLAKEKDPEMLKKLWAQAKRGELGTVKDVRATVKGEKKQSDLSPTEKALKSLVSLAKKFEKLETIDTDQAKDAKNALKGISKVLKEKAQ